MYSRYVALRVRPAGLGIRQTTEGPELPACWFLAEWPAGEPEPVQFWLSDLPADAPLTTLVRLAKLRWRIERDCREMKQALRRAVSARDRYAARSRRSARVLRPR
jgi:SRSO17 transposase